MKLKKVLFFILNLVVLPITGSAQTIHPADMHGIRPGMIAREIILYSHASLDTMEWETKEGSCVIAFKGIYLDDSGQFRVNCENQNISRVTFLAKQRSVEENAAAYHRAIEKLNKLYGKPKQDYHKVYRIVNWNIGTEHISLTTADGGRFYSIALSATH